MGCSCSFSPPSKTLHMLFITTTTTIFFLLSLHITHILISDASLDATEAGYFNAHGLQQRLQYMMESAKVEKVSGEDEIEGKENLFVQKFRALLGLKNFNIRSSSTQYVSPAPSPSAIYEAEGQPPTPAPAPAHQIHLHSHPPRHHSTDMPLLFKIPKEHKGKGKLKTILVAVIVVGIWATVKLWLISSMEPDLLKIFIWLPTAKQVWDAIEKTYSYLLMETEIEEQICTTVPVEETAIPVEETITELEATMIESVEATMSESVEATMTESVEETMTEPVEATMTEPVEATMTEPVEATMTEPVEATMTESSVSVEETMIESVVTTPPLQGETQREEKKEGFCTLLLPDTETETEEKGKKSADLQEKAGVFEEEEGQNGPPFCHNGWQGIGDGQNGLPFCQNGPPVMFSVITFDQEIDIVAVTLGKPKPELQTSDHSDLNFHGFLKDSGITTYKNLSSIQRWDPEIIEVKVSMGRIDVNGVVMFERSQLLHHMSDDSDSKCRMILAVPVITYPKCGFIRWWDPGIINVQVGHRQVAHPRIGWLNLRGSVGIWAFSLLILGYKYVRVI